MTELCEHVMDWHRRAPQVSLRRWCATIRLSRATFYAWRHRQRHPEPDRRHQAPGRPPRGYSVTQNGQKIADGQIMDWITDILTTENAAYGYHKITWVLRRRYHLQISFKKVYRLLRQWHLLWPQRKRRIRHPRRLARNRIITAPNQLWQTDITYVYIAGEDRFLYLQAIIDVCDRMIIAYHMGLHCQATDVVRTLKHAVMQRQSEWQTPPVLRTDNGPQFIAEAFETACAAYGLEHERIPVATPNKNAFIESWHAQLERECLTQEFATYGEAYAAITRWIAFYNQDRLHGSLEFWSPATMRQRVAGGQATWMPVKV
ncbi:Transposase InsO and inactivated derivatives [Sulfobacillus thermosulfidooxidans DSM 9293]|uniref:Transposase InsO and inactivated derivatives n=1 Tax=Sulfobacillus thermosulfidooxidans (strain DSM 9293 / VKM B-1269 / AT-1) TaxID=929705 RepID=A0A1W1WP50_SULTA|nr:IS3 family transposase [Sulfobacillus thermosulfidooxidans]SMC07979.1 Transposase InsO and inactivated derivatives [Sulfobacillus thermosulfidooxidans DSM 9293]